MGAFEWTMNLILIPLVVGVIGGIISNFLTPTVKDWYARRSVRSAKKRLEQIQVELEEIWKYAADSESLTHFMWQSFASILFDLSLAGMFFVFAGIILTGEAYRRSAPSPIFTLPPILTSPVPDWVSRIIDCVSLIINWGVRVSGGLAFGALISVLNRATIKSRETHLLINRIRNLSKYTSGVEKRRTELRKVISRKGNTSDAVSAKPKVIEPPEEDEEIPF